MNLRDTELAKFSRGYGRIIFVGLVGIRTFFSSRHTKLQTFIISETIQVVHFTLRMYTAAVAFHSIHGETESSSTSGKKYKKIKTYNGSFVSNNRTPTTKKTSECADAHSDIPRSVRQRQVVYVTVNACVYMREYICENIILLVQTNLYVQVRTEAYA